MPRVRELDPSEAHRAALALLELRPDAGPAAALAQRVDTQRATGYRLVASFDTEDLDRAAAAAGFRLGQNLAWGRFVYVDDLVTRAAFRGRGHAGALMAWLLEEAGRQDCDQLHLDSGVGRERADAHRLYFGHGLRITSYHFAREAQSRGEPQA